MTKSLADLRSAPPVRSERAREVCLRPDLAARTQMLQRQLEEHLATLTPPVPRARKMGQPTTAPDDPTARELRAELEAVRGEVLDHTGELVSRATITDGEWRTWANAHPPREEDEPGHQRDARLGGFVDADALLADLGRFAVAFNGEQLADGDWDRVFEPSLDHGTKMDIAADVVGMYEVPLDFRRWRLGLRDALMRFNAAASPAPSASASPGSSDESPAPSNEDSTDTATGSD